MTKPEGSGGFIPVERPLPTAVGGSGGAAPRSARATRVSPRGDSRPTAPSSEARSEDRGFEIRGTALIERDWLIWAVKYARAARQSHQRPRGGGELRSPGSPRTPARVGPAGCGVGAARSIRIPFDSIFISTASEVSVGHLWALPGEVIPGEVLSGQPRTVRSGGRLGRAAPRTQGTLTPAPFPPTQPFSNFFGFLR